MFLLTDAPDLLEAGGLILRVWRGMGKGRGQLVMAGGFVFEASMQFAFHPP